jgi:hypothetical protein
MKYNFLITKILIENSRAKYKPHGIPTETNETKCFRLYYTSNNPKRFRLYYKTKGPFHNDNTRTSINLNQTPPHPPSLSHGFWTVNNTLISLQNPS